MRTSTPTTFLRIAAVVLATGVAPSLSATATYTRDSGCTGEIFTGRLSLGSAGYISSIHPIWSGDTVYINTTEVSNAGIFQFVHCYADFTEIAYAVSSPCSSDTTPIDRRPHSLMGCQAVVI